MRHLKWALVAVVVVVALLAPAVVAVLVDRQSKYRGSAVGQATAPFEDGGGSSPGGDPNASPTDALPGDVPVVAIPGREVTVPGAPAPAVTVTAEGNAPVVAPATSFSTKAGSVVVICDSYGPRVTTVESNPGYYSNQVSLVIAALVFFTKPADAANQSITYRLTITCSGGEPKVTVASYIGDQLMTPDPTST